MKAQDSLLSPTNNTMFNFDFERSTINDFPSGIPIYLFLIHSNDVSDYLALVWTTDNSHLMSGGVMIQHRSYRGTD